MRFGPLRNEWLRRARLKQFKENCTIRLYRTVQGMKLYLNPLPWSDQITITSDYEMHVEGFTLFSGDEPIFDHSFGREVIVMPGDNFLIDLSSVSFVIP